MPAGKNQDGRNGPSFILNLARTRPARGYVHPAGIVLE